MKLFLIFSLFLIVFLAGCTASNTTTPLTSTGVSHAVAMTSSGFSPSDITINAGDSVKFTNQDSASHWPASDPHPTHNGYPETGGCTGSKFDACKALGQGETFEFTFTYKGQWCYHDHLNPNLKGCVTVQ
ncbi:MAG: cupredoxin domain-containing protein [Candidatus Aenigmarchaeota archaeon]|nr:cupredoxin domain-containing protein [Candidatus Aenigmarchaeota archaeon]